MYTQKNELSSCTGLDEKNALICKNADNFEHRNTLPFLSQQLTFHKVRTAFDIVINNRKSEKKNQKINLQKTQ